MFNIIENLYVGTMDDYPFALANKYFSILGACKDPLHRKHARLQNSYVDGYTTRAMPKYEPEYLYAVRNHALYCNLIDAPDSKYIPDEIIDRALQFIDDELEQLQKVLIICNKAESRSPSIACMWMIHTGYDFPIAKTESIIECFKRLNYPNYNPGYGFKEYTLNYWKEHKDDGKKKKNNL